MEKNTLNPSFPHTCKIYKLIGVSAWDDGEEEVLYEGECMKYSASSLRTFITNGVVKGEYGVDIPNLVKGVTTGCLMDVTDYIGELKAVQITDSLPSNMGTTVYFNLPKN